MKRTLLKTVCHTIALLILFGSLAACGSGENTGSTASTTPSQTQTSTAAGQESVATAETEPVYPLKTDVKLTYWSEMNPNVSANFTNAGDTPFAQELSKRTGIQVEYIHSTTDEAFALLMASNDLPDIIEFWWDAYPGGASQALADGQIITLNEIMEDYAPNYTQWLKDNPDVARQIRWDEGYYIGFPSVNGDGKTIVVSEGSIIRKDLLEKLGLAVPETVDEWYNALKGFKAQGVSAPFTGSLGYRADFIARAYGVILGDMGIMYIEDGKVVYGPMKPAYKEFLTTWRKWYAEGLIDKDVATIDSALSRAKILDGSAGSIHSYASTVLTYNTTGPDNITGYKMVAAPLPVLKKGDVNKYSYVYNPYEPSDVQAVITKQCKHPDVAARFLDYLWSEEGNILANWGIEGKTYTAGTDGKLHYTDFVLNNPDGWSVYRVRGGYMRSYASGPYAQSPDISLETLQLPEQHEAINLWSKTASLENLLPPVRRNADEDVEYTTIMEEVRVYSEECLLKFMLGTMSLDNFEAYTTQMKKLGIDRAIAIMQAAYERYLAK